MPPPSRPALVRTSLVSAATLGSRLLGFARDAGTAAVLGVGPLADALMAALSLPLLARRLLAEGAFNAALIPTLVRREASGGPAAARPLATATMWLLLALLCLFALLGGLFMPALIRLLAPGFEPGGERADLAIACGRIALIYLPLAGAAAVYGGLANRDGRVVLPSLAPVLANVVVLSAIVFIALKGLIGTAEAAQAMAIATVLAGIAQLALMVRAASGSPSVPGGSVADWRGARAVMRASAPALLFAGLAQLRIILAAAVLSADPGSVSALNYAQRLVDLPLGLVGASAGAVLVPLLAAGGSGAGRQATGAVIAALSLALPAALGLLLLAHPIVGVLYQRGGFTAEDTHVTASLLAVLALALPAQGLERVLAATALTHGLTSAVERIGLGSLVLCLLLVLALSAGFGSVTGVAGIALSAVASASAMVLLLTARGHLAIDRQVVRQLAGLVAASLLMAATLLGLAAWWPVPQPQSFAGVLHLAALIAAGILVYGGVMLALIRRGRRSGKTA